MEGGEGNRALMIGEHVLEGHLSVAAAEAVERKPKGKISK